MNTKQLSIVVTGGRDISSEAAEIAYAIGVEVVRRGHILLTGGSIGADERAARGDYESCQSIAADPRQRIVSFRPEKSTQPRFNYGEVLVAGKEHYQRREKMVEAADAVILVGGMGGTEHVFENAIQQHKPVLPVGQTGGIAQEKWKAVSGALDYYYKGRISLLEFRHLFPGQHLPDDIANWAVILAERLTGGDEPAISSKPGSRTPSRRLASEGALGLAALRRQLDQLFDDIGLDAFCLDHFTEVYERFGRGMRKDEKITLLLDYCRRERARTQKLLSLLEGQI